QEIGKKLRQVYGTKNAIIKLTNLKKDAVEIEGRRIIHLETLGKELNCKKCNSVLSLQNILHEERHGLASIFLIKCHQCEGISKVCSDKEHKVYEKRTHFDTNTKVVIGTLNAGMGNTHLNKVLSALNIPEFNWDVFKVHEKEVGRAVEEMARESCINATAAER
ncbi:PREDICTED: uncharacterized protein LOC108777062, partial [Cyphomyrmex costatus]|uniref:uncharacterized protein LOC108777062 n=1 Tax=Cyphomyrmex costatus TaxID=456900 RepID=UPI0008524271